MDDHLEIASRILAGLAYAELAAECARLNEHCRDLSRQHHEALDEIERLRAGVLDIADRRPMSATTRRRLRELVGAPPYSAVHNEKS